MMIRHFFWGALLFSARLMAHPHEWIELHVTPEANANGEIVALHEHWTFDPYSAQMQLEPILALHGVEKQKQAFAKFAAEVNDSLRAQKFYTYSATPFQPVKDGKLEVNKAGDLVFSFTLPLQKPVAKMAYRIYEPSYFIEMRYADDQKTHWDNGCQLTISEAEPSEKDYALAAGLDKGASAPEGLGELFAQYSLMQCQHK